MVPVLFRFGVCSAQFISCLTNWESPGIFIRIASV